MMNLIAIEKYIYRRDQSGAQRLGHKSRDNLSNTYTARKPYNSVIDLRSSAALSLAISVETSSRCGLRFPTIGARIMMPFSPRLTKRPSVFHILSPATLLAVGFCLAISRILPKL